MLSKAISLCDPNDQRHSEMFCNASNALRRAFFLQIGCNYYVNDLQQKKFSGTFRSPSHKPMEPIALTLGQKFEIEKFSREIDNSDDLAALRSIAKDLLVAWKQQQAASAWIVRQQSQGL